MIKHIFFDLDRTLWDFEKNSHTTLLQLIKDFKLIEKGIDTADNFIKKYKIHNEELWELYREDKIKKEELRGKRFQLALAEYDIDDSEKQITIEYNKSIFPAPPIPKSTASASDFDDSYLEDLSSLKTRNSI